MVVYDRRTGAQTDATMYSQSLDAAASGLKADLAGQPVPIVDQLIAETVSIAERAYMLETQLRRASDELGGLRADLTRARTKGATDALTSLPNRRAFDERLGEAISVASIHRQPLALAFFDIDHFKTFNDTWGHKLGDQVLRLVGGQLARSFRDNGFLARLVASSSSSCCPASGQPMRWRPCANPAFHCRPDDPVSHGQPGNSAGLRSR